MRVRLRTLVCLHHRFFLVTARLQKTSPSQHNLYHYHLNGYFDLMLLGTDAASEGLNLQQFSALINYDLPWNPMRVEQRIGRIDRSGQEAPTVKILNLYMQGTIEEDAYDTLRQRIGAFEDVIGPLQPILAEMPRIFRRLARGEIELAEARRLLDEAARARPHVAIAALEACVREERESMSWAGQEPPSVTSASSYPFQLRHRRCPRIMPPGTWLQPGASVRRAIVGKPRWMRNGSDHA